MKSHPRILLLVSLIVLNAAVHAAKPNVIFILADDLGWADTTLYGHTSLYQTPNLERLAKRGIFTFFPHSPSVPDWLPSSICVHSGDWKLIRLFHQGENGAHGYRLYNLKADLGEAHDLAKAQPDKVRDLDRLIQDHIEQSKAVVPHANPAFDPAQYHPERIGQQTGGLKVGGDDNSKAAKKGAKANKSN